MAVSGDVTFSGDRHAKLHPYLATLVRWCVSCLWSTATVLLHRLMTAPYPAIAAPKPLQKPAPKPRAPGTDHLHPEPKVECVVLHEPPSHTLDVIFVHGLYGSLGNTWRQGDWKSKYKIDPNIIPLRKHDGTNPCKCNINKNEENSLHNVNECKVNEDDVYEHLNENITMNNLNELKKILPNDNSLITEQFYNNTLIEQNRGENYETQAKFVEDMFRNENGCDIKQNTINNHIKCNCNNIIEVNECKCKDNEIKFKDNENKCNVDEVKCKVSDKKTCEMGCGCICDDCYSLCWPRDWIKMDFPGARVISINYTSDPYLWRPLWIKGNKRLRLHERADQMMRKLLEMGVGEKPIIWVGHSKGGLFIKQIYCEAYEAYLNETKGTNDNNKYETNNIIHVDIEDINKPSCKRSDNSIKENINNEENKIAKDDKENCDEAMHDNEMNNKTEINNLNILTSNVPEIRINNIPYNINNQIYINDLAIDDIQDFINIQKIDKELEQKINNCKEINEKDKELNDKEINELNNDNDTYEFGIMNDVEENLMDVNEIMNVDGDLIGVNVNECDDYRVEYDGGMLECDHFELRNGEHSPVNEEMCDDETSSSNTEDQRTLSTRAGLWKNSVGFMFYSVPHRGSPLADIKTPITSRSIELLEISKDCALVLSLQERWLVATRTSQPVVRSLVETCRTLMSVLWLRIVSVDSADAGIGTLSGVSVDHREICKPSSRSCQLYKELTDLIDAALNKCDCR